VVVLSKSILSNSNHGIQKIERLCEHCTVAMQMISEIVVSAREFAINIA
jgi:hypothetical protein